MEFQLWHIKAKGIIRSPWDHITPEDQGKIDRET